MVIICWESLILEARRTSAAVAAAVVEMGSPTRSNMCFGLGRLSFTLIFSGKTGFFLASDDMLRGRSS